MAVGSFAVYEYFKPYLAVFERRKDTTSAFIGGLFNGVQFPCMPCLMPGGGSAQRYN